MSPSDPAAPPSSPFVGVAVPAAGSGRRMGGVRKAYLPLLDEPLLLHALRPFLAHPAVGWVAVAIPPDEAGSPPAWLTQLDPRIKVVAGGATRLESVASALAVLPEEARIVAVHDAARPLVTREIIDRCLAVALAGDGAVAGWPAVDTLKVTDAEGRVTDSPDRSRIWAAHTPQLFPRELLVRAYARALEEGVDATDDSALVARIGGAVRMVEGSRWNLKVTHPSDRVVAEHLLRQRAAVAAGEEGK